MLCAEVEDAGRYGRLTLDAEGRVLQVTILESSGHERLDEAAVREAASKLYDQIDVWTAKWEPSRREAISSAAATIGPIMPIPTITQVTGTSHRAERACSRAHDAAHQMPRVARTARAGTTNRNWRS